MMNTAPPIAVRLPRQLLARIDSLARRLDDTPDTVVLGPWSRSKLIRLSILRGIESIEAKPRSVLGRKS